MISRINCLALWLFAVIAATGCARAVEPLTAADVNTIVAQAVQAAGAAGVTHGFIAVSDREGFILGLYSLSGTPAATDFGPVNAIDKAGTAAFLSSNGEAFTSRTAGYIIQPHFPPGITNTAPGPLTGVGLSSLPFSDINHFRTPGGGATPIPNTSLSGNPGGVPLYKGGVLVGGVGVDTSMILTALVYEGGPTRDENIAVAAQSGYQPPPGILATQVLINGFRLPYTSFSGSSPGLATLNMANYLNPLDFTPGFSPVDSSGVPFQTLVTNDPLLTEFPGSEIRNPIIDSPNLHVTLINGQPRLSAAEVRSILAAAATRASQTRGAIRNPIGPAEVFIVVVDYYASLAAPNAPVVLGSLRTPDATIFSYDVAAQKARTALFFSDNVMAMSSRAMGFLAQGTYPPGIDGTSSGPYGPPTYGPSDPLFPANPLFPKPNGDPSYGIQFAVSVTPAAGNPLLPPGIPVTPINQYLANGITVFPGGFPLYRNGVLIGAVGVSGDGVDQDDVISASGTVNFEAPDPIRADEYSFRGARLPYAKFPQNSSL